MSFDRTKLYNSSLDFFKLTGHAVMKLTPSAALSVCLQAAARHLVVLGIEGGRYDGVGFEARVDCIWDGLSPPLDQVSADVNNLKAAQFVRDKSDTHNAFIITVAPITDAAHT